MANAVGGPIPLPFTLRVGCQSSSFTPTPLSVLDATMYGVFSRVIYFYDLHGTTFEALLAAIAAGLEAALERTPELTGRIVTLGDGMLELHPAPGRGIPLHVEYRNSPSLAALEAANYALTSIPDRLVLPSPFTAAMQLEELLIFQLTAIPGGAILGYNSNHLALDGGSLFHFINGAAALARYGGDTAAYPLRALTTRGVIGDGDGEGASLFTAPPGTTPTVPGSANIVIHPARGMRGFDRIGALLADPAAAAELTASTPPMRAGRLLFPRPQLDALKAKLLAALTPAQATEVGYLSSNDALVGCLWSAITRGPASRLDSFPATTPPSSTSR